MSIQENEANKQSRYLAAQIKDLFEETLDRFNMDIPENDPSESAKLIHKTMQEILDMLKAEIEKGTYN